MNLFETQTNEFAQALGHHNNEYNIKKQFYTIEKCEGAERRSCI